MVPDEMPHAGVLHRKTRPDMIENVFDRDVKNRIEQKKNIIASTGT